jgi:shikimate kinase/3-dehydroquinate synthase
MRPIVLSGFMATGKSTVGPPLAARLGVPFLDTDDAIASAAGRSVPDLWTTEGEAAFRLREVRLVEEWLQDPTPRVIAFGGGTATSRRARHLALERALVVTLQATPETIVSRVKDVAGRPNLALGGDPLARARDLLAQRAASYAECHLSLSTDSAEPEAIVDAIVALVEREPLAVPLGERSYVVDVARAAPSRLTDAIARLAPSSLVVVTDSNVQRALHHDLEHALAPLALPRSMVTLPAGEEHKTLTGVSLIWDAALGAGVDRDAVVVAFGGGVVGDMAGFAASALLRGLRTVVVPTSLLAMVDASVGGKTGFDHPAGKNLLGSFHQPSAVVADLAHLRTLPERERLAGLAEVVKIALVCDAGLLDELERNAPAIALGGAEVLAPIVRRAVEAKIRIVRDDEREQGPRALLNLGHTIGHALEANGHYKKHLHGEAVAMGTIAEMAATSRLGHTPAALVERARALFARLGLETRIPAAELAAAWPFVEADKKRASTRIRLPVVTAPGESHVRPMALDELRAAVLAAPGSPPRV